MSYADFIQLHSTESANLMASSSQRQTNYRVLPLLSYSPLCIRISESICLQNSWHKEFVFCFNLRLSLSPSGNKNKNKSAFFGSNSKHLVNAEFLIDIPQTPPGLKQLLRIRLCITIRAWDLFPLWARCLLCLKQFWKFWAEWSHTVWTAQGVFASSWMSQAWDTKNTSCALRPLLFKLMCVTFKQVC